MFILGYVLCDHLINRLVNLFLRVLSFMCSMRFYNQHVKVWNCMNDSILFSFKKKKKKTARMSWGLEGVWRIVILQNFFQWFIYREKTEA